MATETHQMARGAASPPRRERPRSLSLGDPVHDDQEICPCVPLPDRSQRLIRLRLVPRLGLVDAWEAEDDGARGRPLTLDNLQCSAPDNESSAVRRQRGRHAARVLGVRLGLGVIDTPSSVLAGVAPVIAPPVTLNEPSSLFHCSD